MPVLSEEVWLLEATGPAHRTGDVQGVSACGTSLVDAKPSTRSACKVYNIPTCSGCFPVHIRTAKRP